MKPIEEQDHYEILEIPRDADPVSIERAYRLAHSTYSDDSLALYSLFGSGAAGDIRKRVEVAYQTLSNSAARAEYDAGLGAESSDSGLVFSLDAPAIQPQPVAADSDLHGLEDLEDEADPGSFDGPRLRRARLRQGLEIDQIAAITKINPLYLRYLEEERFEELPAPVYVRGFLVAFAQVLGLDAQKAASRYMARFEAAQPPVPKRSRLRGRR